LGIYWRHIIVIARFRAAHLMLPCDAALTLRNGVSIMISKLMVRSGVVAIAAAAMLGLAGCSLMSNGYGGWYWQSPSESQSTTNQNNTGNYNATAGPSQNTHSHG
jgi:hypothetical protein